MTSPPPLPVLRQLLNEAQPDKWVADHQEYGDEWWFGGSNGPGEVTVGPFVGYGDERGRAAAALVAAAVSSLPALLDLVERQAAAIEAVQELADEIRDRPVAAQFVHANAIREALFSLSGITPTTKENSK